MLDPDSQILNLGHLIQKSIHLTKIFFDALKVADIPVRKFQKPIRCQRLGLKNRIMNKEF